MKINMLGKERIISALRASGGVVAEAARQLGVSREGLRNWLFRNEDVNRLRLALVGVSKIRSDNRHQTFWEKKHNDRLRMWDFFKDWTGWVVVIPDLHIPQTNWEKVEEMLEWVGNNTSSPRLAILGGDNLNLDTFARFVDADRSFELGETGIPKDIEQYKNFVDAIDTMFEFIIIIEGNHDKRVMKSLLRSMKGAEADYILNLIDLNRLIKGGNNRIFTTYDWFFRIGDLVVSHLERYSVVPGRVGTWVSDTLKMRMPDTRAFIQAHVHRLAWIPYRDTLTIECGMLSKVPDYVRLKGGSASRYEMTYYGFAVAYLDNGVTDFNKTRPIYLGREDLWPILKD